MTSRRKEGKTSTFNLCSSEALHILYIAEGEDLQNSPRTVYDSQGNHYLEEQETVKPNRGQSKFTSILALPLGAES